MSTVLSVICKYSDTDNLIKHYKIYYNSEKKSFTDSTDSNKNSQDITRINIEEDGQLVIYYTGGNAKTIKNIQSIHIDPDYKQSIQDKGLNMKGTNNLDIGRFATRKGILNLIENMIDIIKVYACLDKEIEDKFNYINNNQLDSENIFNFMINYSSYLGLQAHNNYDAKDIVLKQLCIGIIRIKMNTIYDNNNQNIENVKYLFCFKRDIVKTIIDYLKDKPIETITQIIDELFINYDITKLNEYSIENIMHNLETLLSNIESSNKKISENDKKILTLSNK